MSLKDNLGKIAGKAKVVAEKSGDKIASGVDKATDKIDKKTGGKYHDKLEKVDKLASKLDKDKDAGAADATATDVTDPAAEVVPPEAEGDATPPTGTIPS
jgi:hypothetical protein